MKLELKFKGRKIKTRSLKILLIIVLVLEGIKCCTYNVNSLRVKNYTFTSSALPSEFDGFRIGFISDINLNSKNTTSDLKKIVNKLNKKNTDMVIFGGDLYEGQVFDQDEVSSLLKSIDAPYGKFAVLGEKDLALGNSVTSVLSEGGFEVLDNSDRTIYYNDASIHLFGLQSTGDCTSLIKKKNKDSFKLVAVHQPDYFTKASEFDINLQLSGHSNGGYFRIPLIRGILRKKDAKTYTAGHYTRNDSHLYVSNGCNVESDDIFKFGCPNEILIVKLKYKKAAE